MGVGGADGGATYAVWYPLVDGMAYAICWYVGSAGVTERGGAGIHCPKPVGIEVRGVAGGC